MPSLAPSDTPDSISRIAGWMVRDVLLTPDEVKGLLADLLISAGPPAGKTRLSDWLKNNAGMAGRTYASELARHYR